MSSHLEIIGQVKHPIGDVHGCGSVYAGVLPAEVGKKNDRTIRKVCEVTEDIDHHNFGWRSVSFSWFGGWHPISAWLVEDRSYSLRIRIRIYGVWSSYTIAFPALTEAHLQQAYRRILSKHALGRTSSLSD